MDKLQAFIRDNKQSFNASEPPRGHLERFRAKLDAKSPRSAINLWLVATAAAVAGIFLTASLSLLLNFNTFTAPESSGLVSVSLSPEIIQIDEYYQYQVNQRQQIISKLISGEATPMSAEIKKTLNDLNSGYTAMIQDVSESPRPDRAAFVLTRYYQAQLDVLEGIIAQIQTVKLINHK